MLHTAKDLEGKTQVTKVSDFDVTKYVNEDKQMTVETLSGGWTTNIPGKPMMLGDEVGEAFDEATGKIVGVTYYPIRVLAKQEKDFEQQKITFLFGHLRSC